MRADVAAMIIRMITGIRIRKRAAVAAVPAAIKNNHLMRHPEEYATKDLLVLRRFFAFAQNDRDLFF